MDSTRDQVLLWTIFGTLMVLGFIAGAVREWLPRAPAIVAVSIVLGYYTLLAVTAGWAASCPECGSHISYDSARWADLFFAILYGAIFTGGILLFVGLGSGFSILLQRLRPGRG